MAAQVGDKIIIESEKAASTGRVGTIEEILQQNPPRFLVRWDDRRKSIFTPAAGVATIKKQRKRKTKS